MKKLASIYLVASASLFAPAAAQEAAPLPESDVDAAAGGAESLGETLLISEPIQDGAALIAAEPVSLDHSVENDHRGSWRVVPQLSAKGTYDDNIFIQRENRVADYIFALSPGVAFGFWDSDYERERYLERRRGTALLDRTRGDFLVVQYTALLLGFVRTPSQNTLDHDARLSARWQREKLTLGATVLLESKSETNTEVGDRIRRKSATAEVTSTYQLTEKIAAGLALSNNVNDPENYARTVDWRAESSLDYSATPLVRFGFGAVVGKVQVQGGTEHVFQRLLARTTYSLSEKLEAEFRGGVEFRQSSGPVADRTSPIFEVRLAWLPVVGTHVGLEAFRRVNTSIEDAGRNIIVNGGAITVRRDLRGGVYFDAAAGFEVANYSSDAGAEQRDDRYWFVRPGIWYNFAPWASAGVTYEHRRNASTRRDSSFVNNQVSVEITLTY